MNDQNVYFNQVNRPNTTMQTPGSMKQTSGSQCENNLDASSLMLIHSKKGHNTIMSKLLLTFTAFILKGIIECLSLSGKEEIPHL